MDCKEIITKFLRANGYSGLYSEIGDCACSIDGGLFPCGGCFETCEPGYLHPGDGDYDYYIKSEKPEQER